MMSWITAVHYGSHHQDFTWNSDEFFPMKYMFTLTNLSWQHANRWQVSATLLITPKWWIAKMSSTWWDNSLNKALNWNKANKCTHSIHHPKNKATLSVVVVHWLYFPNCLFICLIAIIHPTQTRRPPLWWEESGQCPRKTQEHPQVVGRPSHVGLRRRQHELGLNSLQAQFLPEKVKNLNPDLPVELFTGNLYYY